MPIILNKKFEYKALQRVDSPTGRLYVVSETSSLPSVTTILSKVKDTSHLDTWRERVGIEEANRIRDEASRLGSAMHNYLEDYILGKDPNSSFMPTTLAKVIIKNGLVNVNEVWGTETNLYMENLYAGTTDVVGLHSNIPSIIDFKNSLNPKKVEWIDDYRAQLAAYALAHNEMYGTDIKKGVVMVATRDAKYQEFIFEGAEFDRCIELWVTALQKYYDLIS